MSRERSVAVEMELDPSQLGCEERGGKDGPRIRRRKRKREKKANTVKFGQGEVKYSPSQEIWKRNQIHRKIGRYVGEGRNKIHLKSGGLGREERKVKTLKTGKFGEKRGSQIQPYWKISGGERKRSQIPKN